MQWDKNLVASLLELTLTKKTLICLKIFKAVNEIFRHIKQLSNQLTKKTLTVKISIKLEFKSDNMTKSNAIKYIVIKYFPIISKAVWFYFGEKMCCASCLKKY